MTIRKSFAEAFEIMVEKAIKSKKSYTYEEIMVFSYLLSENSYHDEGTLVEAKDENMEVENLKIVEKYSEKVTTKNFKHTNQLENFISKIGIRNVAIVPTYFGYFIETNRKVLPFLPVYFEMTEERKLSRKEGRKTVWEKKIEIEEGEGEAPPANNTSGIAGLEDGIPWNGKKRKVKLVDKLS